MSIHGGFPVSLFNAGTTVQDTHLFVLTLVDAPAPMLRSRPVALAPPEQFLF